MRQTQLIISSVVSQIRALAVALRSENIDYRCHLCCQGQLFTSIHGVREIHSDHFDFPYGTAEIEYPLPPGCESPSSIAVYSAADTSGGTDIKNETCRHLLVGLQNATYHAPLTPTGPVIKS